MLFHLSSWYILCSDTCLQTGVVSGVVSEGVYIMRMVPLTSISSLYPLEAEMVVSFPLLSGQARTSQQTLEHFAQTCKDMPDDNAR